MDPAPNIPWARLAAFVRQHTHDVRNHLNSLDLEAALLEDLVTTDEARSCVDRIRAQVRDFAARMRALSARFADPSPNRAVIPASMLVLIWRDQLNSLKPAPEVTWKESLGEACVNVDASALAGTFRELLQNAVLFGSDSPLRADAAAIDGHVDFTLTESKHAPVIPDDWGSAPLTTTRRGGYGLGLWDVERAVTASGGEVHRHFDSDEQELVTTLRFPTAQ